MTPLEQEILGDGFLLLLLEVQTELGGNEVSWRAALFDGGRECAGHQELGLWVGRVMVADARLSEMIQRLLTTRHLVVWCGRHAEMLLTMSAEGCAADLRRLSLLPTAAALAGLPPHSGSGQLAAAFGVPQSVVLDAAFGSFATDLMWAVFSRAGQGGLAIDDLTGLAAAARPVVSFAGYEFDAETLQRVPAAPGVYIMRDESGAVLYVGKAAVLAQRLQDYFRAQAELPPKLAAIRGRIARLEWRLVGSELEALLVEHRLIDELQPEINVQRNIKPGSSRYQTRSRSVVVVAPSQVPDRRELFIFGHHCRALQLRVQAARLPRRYLQRLLQAIADGGRTALPKHRHLTDWGEPGDEICLRYWGRYRAKLVWLETSASVVETAALLGDAIAAAATDNEPAEFRLGDAVLPAADRS